MTESRRSMEEQLEILIRLTAIQVLGEKKGAEAITVLGQAGLDAKAIAELLGTTEATVRSRLSKERKKLDAKDATPGKKVGAKSEFSEY